MTKQINKGLKNNTTMARFERAQDLLARSEVARDIQSLLRDKEAKALGHRASIDALISSPQCCLRYSKKLALGLQRPRTQ